MMTGKEYIDSLRELKTIVYAFGEKLDNFVDHPLIRPHVNAAAATYEMAHEPEFEDLVTATSHLTGEKVSRFTHIHHSTDDLIRKVKMLRAISQRTGSCYQRCVGFDGINALYATTYEIDQKYGTNYHGRMKEYILHLQQTDKMVAGSMTDPKGDRGLSPGKQADPDLYVHVVEKNDKGYCYPRCQGSPDRHRQLSRDAGYAYHRSGRGR
jgi:4-hydroxybutyryl-CoA dehydratase / vinylacetyl-CoA-Delta-isomerase